MNPNEETKNIALNTVVEAFSLAKTAREPYDRKWNRYFRLVKGIASKRKQKWMSNRFIPYTASIVDLIFPRLAARRPAATVVGRDESSGLNQEKFGQLLNYQQDMMNVDTVFVDWILNSIRYGTSFLKMSWKKEVAQNVPRTSGFLDKITGYFRDVLGMDVKQDDFLYDGPDCQSVDVFDMFVHPKATNRDDALFMIHRTEQTKYALKRNPVYKKEVVDSISVTASHDIDEFRRQRLVALGLNTPQANKIVESMADTHVEVLEYWGLFDINNDGEDEECVITVANRSTILRIEENPYYHGKKPFIVLKYHTEPNMFYGEGVIERIEELQLELNDIANQAADLRKLTLLPVIKTKRNANLSIETMEIAPGLPLAVDNVDDITFERPPDFTSQLEFMSKSIRELMQISTGATDVILGQGDVGIASDTLGGMQIAQEQSALRFRIPGLLLDIAIQEYGEMLIALNQQYYDRKKTIRIFTERGLSYREIAPRDLSGMFTYRVQPMSMAPQSQAQRRTDLVNLKNLFVGNQMFNESKLDRMIIESFDIDPDILLSASPESNAALEQFKQLSPEQQELYISRLSPQDQDIMRRAIGNQGGTNATTPALATNPVGESVTNA